MKNKFLLLLSAGHIATDLNQGALPAILPFLVAAGGLSYANAAGLSFAVAMASSLVQPLFGIWSDKFNMRWLIPIGTLMAGLFMSLLGPLHEHYWLMFAVAVLSGIGVAAFHPEAARMANQLAGKKKGGGMSIFSVGGSLGFAMGPAIVTAVMLYAGLSGSLVLAFPALAMFTLLRLKSSPMRDAAVLSLEREKAASPALAAGKNEWGMFWWLTVAIIFRSIIFHNINTFLPLYWVNVLGQSMASGGVIPTIMFIAGAVGVLLGGQLADRVGLNAITRISAVLVIPALFIFTRVTNPVLAVICVVLMSLLKAMANTPMIILGQKFLSGNMGFASGVTLGLSVSVGGMVAPLVGRYADIHGLLAAFQLLAFLPLVPAIVTLTLKRPVVDRE